MLFNLCISRDVDRLIVSHVAELQSFLETKIIDLALSTSQDTYPHLSCDIEGKNLVDNFGRFEKEDAIFGKLVTSGVAKKTTHDKTRTEHPKRFNGAIQEAGIVGRVLGSMSPINILKQEAKQGKINGKTTSTGVELKNLALSRMTQSVSIVFFSASLLTMN